MLAAVPTTQRAAGNEEVADRYAFLLHELGELENQRVGLLTQGRNGEMHRARVHWSQLVGLLRQIATTLAIAEPAVVAVARLLHQKADQGCHICSFSS